jgi:mannose-6-phosphate isomerase-like protein (cupin superfamily)
MKIDRSQTQENPHNPQGVDVRQLYDNESAQFSHITLEPGEGLKPHKTPVDVFFVVLEGTPYIMVGDEEELCEKDTLIESPANVIHNIRNVSNSLARILVVKAPRPATMSRIL